jgi:hypothetical protein
MVAGTMRSLQPTPDGWLSLLAKEAVSTSNGGLEPEQCMR